MKIRDQGDKAVGALYLCASFSLAFFCLFQSHRMSHDARNRDLAGRSIHAGATAPKTNTPQLLPSAKKIGEGSD